MQAVLQLIYKIIGQLKHKPCCYWLGHNDTRLCKPGAPNFYFNWRRCEWCGRYTGDHLNESR